MTYTTQPTRKWLPSTIVDADALQNHINNHAPKPQSVIVDEMTDQIDVRVNGRRIAVYFID